MSSGKTHAAEVCDQYVASALIPVPPDYGSNWSRYRVESAGRDELPGSRPGRFAGFYGPDPVLGSFWDLMECCVSRTLRRWELIEFPGKLGASGHPASDSDASG